MFKPKIEFCQNWNIFLSTPWFLCFTSVYVYLCFSRGFHRKYTSWLFSKREAAPPIIIAQLNLWEFGGEPLLIFGAWGCVDDPSPHLWPQISYGLKVALFVIPLIPLRKLPQPLSQRNLRRKPKILFKSCSIRVCHRHITRLHGHQLLVSIKIVIFRQHPCSY